MPTDFSRPGPPRRSSAWLRQAAFFLGALLLAALIAYALQGPLEHYLYGQEDYDQTALRDWLDEARCSRETLRELIDGYLTRAQAYHALPEAKEGDPDFPRRELEHFAVATRREEIREHLQALGTPATKLYPGQLPLFPIIYRIEVRFLDEPDDPIVWDSQLPLHSGQARELRHEVHPRATVIVKYQLHAYNKRLRTRLLFEERRRKVVAAAVTTALIVLPGLVLIQRRERQRERQRALAEHQAELAQRKALEEARRREETERDLLEQRLAAQAAERKALELQTQLYASIGIMAGSYAHNIKNLLVRPHDLLRRCLEADGLTAEQSAMLDEVRRTLGTVTDRLQQILRTVRRDPTRSEPTRLDLNELVRESCDAWADLARDRWKADLELDAADGPLWIAGDASHLQQAVENLLFNARDATFEMRNHLRDAARKDAGLDAAARRQALIAAAAWRGRVVLRTRREGDRVVLEVSDNGAGMTEEVRRRCTETHFSTKRDNALYEGHSTGMGLGLAFVVAILEHHRATLEIESGPLKGATFRVRFPAAPAAE
jgi:signal transduction histidine kinase